MVITSYLTAVASRLRWNSVKKWPRIKLEAEGHRNTKWQHYRSYRGHSSGDWHVSYQEEGEQGDVARHSSSPRQRHEVIPVVHERQDGNGNERFVLRLKGRKELAPKTGELLHICPHLFGSATNMRAAEASASIS